MYTATTTDPDGDDVYYKFKYSDGSESDWVGPYNSGTAGGCTHIWDTPGEYTIKAKAMDINGLESGWSDPLTVIISEGNVPPYKASNPQPDNGASDVSRHSDLYWEGSDPDGDPLLYDVYFGTSSSLGESDRQVENYPYDAYVLGTLNYDQKYYWRIDTKDIKIIGEDEFEILHTRTGDVWSFTVEDEPCCFPAGTLISMADGSSKAIEDIELGDCVLSYDFESDCFDSWIVKMLGRPIHPVCSINNGLLSCTVDHPIHVKKADNSRGIGAVDAVRSKDAILFEDDVLSLEIGDRLFTQDNEWIEIESIDMSSEKIQTYNILSFSGNRNFFANGILVYEEHPDTAFTSVILENFFEKYPRLSEFVFSMPWVIKMFTP